GMREDYNLWFRRGLVYIRLNRTKEALTDIEESIRLNPMKNKKKAAKNTYPSLIKSTFAKATILDKEEDFPAAIYQYSEVLRLSNEMNIENAEISQLIPQVHLGRGYLYLEIDSLKLAKDDLIEVSKDTSQYRCTAFQLLADIGIRDSAYEDLSKYYDGLVECEPEEDLLKYSRGYYSSRAGQYEKALKDFEFVLDKIELTQLLQATHNQMAYCYLGLKQYDKALESLDKTLTLNVLNGESYYYKGKVYAAKGMTKKACENFEKSLNYNAQGDYRNEAISQMKELCGGWEEDE
ncbi:MAG: tetratricopeptide repeat protein, partial [Bacteroidia bacterium]|nr:tetratricopeptide repeat protein [Bacteroidia bacterium]